MNRREFLPSLFLIQAAILSEAKGAEITGSSPNPNSVVSVKDFGAVGDGIADDTGAIQKAINASTSVFFPSGIYRTTSTITCGAKRLYGETQSSSVIKLNHSGIGINIINTSTYGLSVSSLCIAGNGSSTAISIQSTTEVTSHAHFEDLRIYNHMIGIGGTSTYTLFDSYLEKVDFISCSKYGFKLSGSQNTLISCTFRLCNWGVYVDSMNGGYSIGGGSFTGGVFIGNSYDIVVDTLTVRPLSFDSVWFEQTANLSLGKLTGVSEVLFVSLSFDKCLFQPASTALGNGVIDQFNYKGLISFERCMVYKNLYSSANLPNETIGLGDLNSIICRKSCATIDRLGGVVPLKDFTTNSRINIINIYNLNKYINDAEAGTKGLVNGDIYFNTSLGALSVKN